jgi:hypothetical protein
MGSFTQSDTTLEWHGGQVGRLSGEGRPREPFPGSPRNGLAVPRTV